MKLWMKLSNSFTRDSKMDESSFILSCVIERWMEVTDFTLSLVMESKSLIKTFHTLFSIWWHSVIWHSRQLVPLWLAASFFPTGLYHCLVAAHIQWYGHPVVRWVVVWICVGSKRRILGPYFDAMPRYNSLLFHCKSFSDLGILTILGRFQQIL
jgi:hypothetical protein